MANGTPKKDWTPEDLSVAACNSQRDAWEREVANAMLRARTLEAAERQAKALEKIADSLDALRRAYRPPYTP